MEPTNELQKKFRHRDNLREGNAAETQRPVGTALYQKFPEFTLKKLREMENFFKKYDSKKQGMLEQADLQRMFEEMGNALTYLQLKEMIVEADKDGDKRVDFEEFLLMIRKVSEGGVDEDNPWASLAALQEIEVATEGVGGAKNFFEAKVKVIENSNRFEKEVMAEREGRKKEAEEKKVKKEAFKNLRQNFQ